MAERAQPMAFADFDRPLSERTIGKAAFARLSGWSDGARADLSRYLAQARRRGAVVEGRLENPDGAQIARLAAALGDDFAPTAAYAAGALEKWLSALGGGPRRAFCEVLDGEYRALAAKGKPEAVRKNLFVKLMCWLRDDFGSLVPLLGEDAPPKALYVGATVTAHELVLLRALNAMGADVLLVLTGGDAAYAKLDPDGRWARTIAGGDAPIPASLSLSDLAQPAAAKPTKPAEPARSARGAIVPEAYFKTPRQSPCVNAWMAEPDYCQILTPPDKRGGDPALYYTALVRLTGARDRATYAKDLFDLYRALTGTGRRALTVDGPMPAPTPQEIAGIRRRGRYNSPEELIVDLAVNLPPAGDDLLALMQRAFLRAMRAEAKAQSSLRKLEEAGVYLLCRARRYHEALFHSWREGQVPVFILMGGCADGRDALYVRWLSALPVDVLLLAPDLEKPCAFADAALLDLKGEASLPPMKFPRDEADLRVSTLAADAEWDMDRLLYADSGLYRSRQFDRASAVTLRTTADELFILWDQDLRYRQGFAAEDGAVTMPVLYAKLCGVERGDMAAYWQRVKRLAGGDALFFDRFPLGATAGGFQSLAVKCVKNGRLDRRALTEDRRYPFALLRPEIQAHMLDKLQLMLERRLIRGTFENGAEYTAVAAVLGMGPELTRRLQAFDFTKKNPKLVCVSAGEDAATPEDACLLTFLNLAGFDIALFVPTGYRSAERFMADNLPVEHQLGEYVYDQRVPDLDALPGPKGPSLLDRLFRRNN